MAELDTDTVGYGGVQASLRFHQSDLSYSPRATDLYWKIAISVPNIQLAHQQLTEKGIEVSEPTQFKDVGYLAHFKDTEGFTIELIEHWFKGNRPAITTDKKVLGGGPHLNLLTLRSNHIQEVTSQFSQLGMKLLSIQPVESHRFTLYFFAFTDESPPDLNAYAVVNREWVYQRDYTVLEIQYLHDRPEIRQRQSDSAGYIGTKYTQASPNFRLEELAISSGDITEK